MAHGYQFRPWSPNDRKIYSDTLELYELILLTDKFQKKLTLQVSCLFSTTKGIDCEKLIGGKV